MTFKLHTRCLYRACLAITGAIRGMSHEKSHQELTKDGVEGYVFIIRLTFAEDRRLT